MRFFYDEFTLVKNNNNAKQNSIPVGCVPPAFGVGCGRVYTRYLTHPGYSTPPRKNMGPELPYPLPVDIMTHACENITFPQLRLRAVMNNRNIDLH